MKSLCYTDIDKFHYCLISGVLEGSGNVKKFICILLVALFVVSTAFADFDLSSMSDAELQELITSAKKELDRRASSTKDIVLYEKDGIRAYLTKKHAMRETVLKEKLVDFSCVLENNTNRIVELHGIDCAVNDWEIGFASFFGSSSSGFKAAPGKKTKGVMCLNLSKAGITMYNQIEKIDFTLGIYFDGVSYYSNPPDISVPVHLVLSGANISLVE